jgi:hypothetical protein
MRARPDRRGIKETWVADIVSNPERQEIQADGRIRRWARIEEAGHRALRVVLAPDGETVHKAFFERGYKP